MRFNLSGAIETLPHMPEERTIAANCKANGKLWSIFGRGLTPAGAAHGADRNDCVSFDLCTQTWTNHGPSPVPARYCSQPIVKPGEDGQPDRIYVIGGATDNTSPRTFYGDVWSMTNGTDWCRESSCTLSV
jgi:hypothetical protein